MPYEISAKVLNKIWLSKNTYLLELFAPQIASRAKPGQFVMLEVPGKFLRRPLSIAGVDGNRVTIVFRVVGEGTKNLSLVRRHTQLSAFGPLGKPFPTPESKAILIGGGIGVVPLIFFARELIKTGQNFELIYGEKSAEYLLDERFPDIRFRIFTEDGSKGEKGTVLDGLKITKDDVIYACGPTPMIRALKRILESKNNTCWVSLEQRMACGIGVCRGCVVKLESGYKTVCRDGPIFLLSEIDVNSLIEP